jgi:hypothetical protein
MCLVLSAVRGTADSTRHLSTEDESKDTFSLNCVSASNSVTDYSPWRWPSRVEIWRRFLRIKIVCIVVRQLVNIISVWYSARTWDTLNLTSLNLPEYLILFTYVLFIHSLFYVGCKVAYILFSTNVPYILSYFILVGPVCGQITCKGCWIHPTSLFDPCKYKPNCNFSIMFIYIYIYVIL